MKKTRTEKMIIILILVVAIAGMSLGFAAFSKLLTINATATVSPDPSDFYMHVYGLNSETEINNMKNGQEPNFDDWSLAYPGESPGYAYQITSNYFLNINKKYGEDDIENRYTAAKINNTGDVISIEGVRANFFAEGSYYYVWAIENNSEYDAKLSFPDEVLAKITERKVYGTCTANSDETGVTQEKINDWCENITSYAMQIADSKGTDVVSSILQNGSYVLKKGDYILIIYGVFNNNSVNFVQEGLTSGFTVTFDDMSMNITSTLE